MLSPGSAGLVGSAKIKDQPSANQNVIFHSLLIYCQRFDKPKLLPTNVLNRVKFSVYPVRDSSFHEIIFFTLTFNSMLNTLGELHKSYTSSIG